MATISSLSQELICRIAEFLPQRHDYSNLPVLKRPTGPNPSQLPPYACVSRPWQHAIERRTFEAVTIDSNHVADLARVLVAHRRHLLRVLTYNLVIPPYVQKNIAATRAIHDLFALLSSWGVDAAGQTMRLNIGIAYPDRPQTFQPVVVFDDVEELPSITHITELEFVRHQRCNFDSPSAARLAAKLPCLVKAWLSIHDDPQLMSTAERRAMRLSLAQALPALTSSSLTSLHIDAPDCAPQDEAFEPPRLSDAGGAADPLSLALHRLSLSPHLATLRISGALTIDPSLFWPPPPPPDAGGSTTPPPSWPSLTTLVVKFSMVAPDGGWYFTGAPGQVPPDDNDSDDDSLDSDPSWDFGATQRTSTRAIAAGMYPTRWFRRTPDAARINPLFLAVARAASRMPRLEWLEVSVRARCGGGKEGEAANMVCETAVVGPGRRHRLDKRFGREACRDRERVYVSVPGMVGLLDGRIVDVWSDGGRRLVRVVDT
ncbi:uncharacterized protein LTHEOB_8597 [Lasiodiplodia theobromae]|uniref:uncharacterized protein n=1 Tax=Lasiodiplodia theobromae TaxID=45133 RepID=UPI0015C2DFE4|nr:uncharacterized protein LTHEOB_8597 [Lasiodiplodia theobromae]KAF4541602.1 hypothetical protein LTHEOB_8597 [Lasiodiplodia theobromae]